MPDLGALKARVLALRADRPWVDHLFRTYATYTAARGNQMAGAVTYFAFLSFFPLLALSFSVLGWVVVVWPEAQAQVESFLTENLPGLVGGGSGQLDPASIAGAKAGAGLAGLAGLLYAGLGWLDALREALRQVYGLEPGGANIVVRKLLDVALLAMLGTGLLLTLASSSLATALTRELLDLVGLAQSTLAAAALKVLAVALSVLGDMLLLSLVFSRLPGHRLPWRFVRSGALLGAVLLAVLKLLGTWLIARTTGNAVYGAFAVVVGLLVWLNLIGRVVLLASAWTVTAAQPIVAPTLADEPKILVPVLDPEQVTASGRKAWRRRALTALGVAGLVAVRRRRRG